MRKKNLIKEYDRYYQSFKAKNLYPSEYLVRILRVPEIKNYFNFVTIKIKNY